jgi:hypothetical protein
MVQTDRVPGAQAAHANFQWDDSLLLELQLTEEERMIRDTARRDAQEQLLPRETEAYPNEETDREMGRADRRHVSGSLRVPRTRSQS